MADPLDVNAMDDISIITGCQIEPLIATPRSVMVAIDKFYGSDEVASALEEYAKEKFGDDDINEEINDDINNSPIVVLVKEMIEKAARQRASDIHIEPMENRFVSATVSTVPCMKRQIRYQDYAGVVRTYQDYRRYGYLRKEKTAGRPYYPDG